MNHLNEMRKLAGIPLVKESADEQTFKIAPVADTPKFVPEADDLVNVVSFLVSKGITFAFVGGKSPALYFNDAGPIEDITTYLEDNKSSKE